MKKIAFLCFPMALILSACAQTSPSTPNQQLQNVNPVMVRLFSLNTPHSWQINLPDSSTTQVTLNQFKTIGDTEYLTGEYRNSDERGELSLNYRMIHTIPWAVSRGEAWFLAPFSLSNQGSGNFYYLGLFKLDTRQGTVTDKGHYFLGDRIQIRSIKPAQSFDVTGLYRVELLQHGSKQPMFEAPNQKVEQWVKISMEGLTKGQP